MTTLSIAVSAKDHQQGDASAQCTLVEYGDYQCPSCGRAYPIVKRVQKHFGKRLLFVFRNFPLSQLHPWAETAAETAEFAGANGKYWEMHDALFENQERFSEDFFSELAGELGLSASGLETALEKETYRAHVKADFSGGVRSGVNGTPTFFVNGRRHNGPYDFEFLVQAIEDSLGEDSN
ncbi:MAG: thioredoxin domain-containing protein [Terracidiphilus sp.]|jgi:protein-disulfide isomerase